MSARQISYPFYTHQHTTTRYSFLRLLFLILIRTFVLSNPFHLIALTLHIPLFLVCTTNTLPVLHTSTHHPFLSSLRRTFLLLIRTFVPSNHFHLIALTLPIPLFLVYTTYTLPVLHTLRHHPFYSSLHRTFLLLIRTFGPSYPPSPCSTPIHPVIPYLWFKYPTCFTPISTQQLAPLYFWSELSFHHILASSYLPRPSLSAPQTPLPRSTHTPHHNSLLSTPHPLSCWSALSFHQFLHVTLLWPHPHGHYLSTYTHIIPHSTYVYTTTSSSARLHPLLMSTNLLLLRSSQL